MENRNKLIHSHERIDIETQEIIGACYDDAVKIF